jgi:DNA-binding NarL/FixJ family response regulator
MQHQPPTSTAGDKDDNTTSAASSHFIAPIPVSIVSNSYLLREGLLKLLSETISLHLVMAYPGEPLPNTRLLIPSGHVVLIDGGIGHALLLNWIRAWHQLRDAGHILVLELTNDAKLILACIEAGADGYTLEGATLGDIAQAIQLVQQGRAQCSPQMTAHLFARLAALKSMMTTSTTNFVMPLTTRELQVLTYIGRGYSNKEIALDLVISLRTVKYHVHNILQKLNLSHRRDAVQFARQQGWIDQNPPA